MHEMALAEGILGVVLDAAHGQPVRRVRVRVGALQRVLPESLRFCFELAAQETAAAGAAVDIDEVLARVRCRGCRAESPVEDAVFQCRACGAFDVEVVAGQELLVAGLELEDG
jgi:hydrogenase nickel incorporation protein HypA/HybF